MLVTNCAKRFEIILVNKCATLYLDSLAIVIFYNTPCLKDTQKLCEILLYRGEVHFVKADKKRNVWVHFCLYQEFDELGKDIFLLKIAPISQQLRRVVPIGLYLNHTIVARRCSVFVLQFFRATLESKFPYDSALSCS